MSLLRPRHTAGAGTVSSLQPLPARALHLLRSSRPGDLRHWRGRHRSHRRELVRDLPAWGRGRRAGHRARVALRPPGRCSSTARAGALRKQELRGLGVPGGQLPDRSSRGRPLPVSGGARALRHGVGLHQPATVHCPERGGRRLPDGGREEDAGRSAKEHVGVLLGHGCVQCRDRGRDLGARRLARAAALRCGLRRRGRPHPDTARKCPPAQCASHPDGRGSRRRLRWPGERRRGRVLGGPRAIRRTPGGELRRRRSGTRAGPRLGGEPCYARRRCRDRRSARHGNDQLSGGPATASPLPQSAADIDASPLGHQSST